MSKRNCTDSSATSRIAQVSSCEMQMVVRGIFVLLAFPVFLKWSQLVSWSFPSFSVMWLGHPYTQIKCGAQVGVGLVHLDAKCPLPLHLELPYSQLLPAVLSPGLNPILSSGRFLQEVLLTVSGTFEPFSYPSFFLSRFLPSPCHIRQRKSYLLTDFWGVQSFIWSFLSFVWISGTDWAIKWCPIGLVLQGRSI